MENTKSTCISIYRQELEADRNAAAWQGGTVRGTWAPDPAVTPDRLAQAVSDAEEPPASAVLKQSDRIRVVRASLFGRDVLIKRYDLVGPFDRLKYRFRPSRARRAWATARTFIRSRIPTPEPLGFLEVLDGSLPVRSYFLTEFLVDARSARKWIQPHFPRQPPAVKDAVRRELLDLLLSLYRHGAYHKDTKTANLLLRSPEDPARRAFFWIDLECVSFGVRPSRHQIVRNLVQLNGSLGTKVSEEDRLAFLRDMARHYPWVDQPRVVGKIRAWTHKRLLKELRLKCGS